MTFDTDPPVFLGATVVANALVLAFSDYLDRAHVPVVGSFVAEVGGTPVTVDGVSIGRDLVTLVLNTPVDDTDLVTVAYTAPGTNPLQDEAGNLAPSFTETEATNETPTSDITDPVLASLDVDGGEAHLVYEETLDPSVIPATSAFAVVRGHSSLGVSAVDISGNIVTLDLTTPAEFDDHVYMAYAAPMSDPLVDPAGNEAPSFILTGAWNLTAAPDPSPPSDPVDPACDDGDFGSEATTSRWVFEDPVSDNLVVDSFVQPETDPSATCVDMGYSALAEFHFAAGGSFGFIALQKQTATPDYLATMTIYGGLSGTCSGEVGATCGFVTDGYAVTVPYPWVAGNYYRLRLAFDADNGDGTSKWLATVVDGGTDADYAGGPETEVGSIDVPSWWGALVSPVVNRVEWFGGPINECRFLPAWSVSFGRPAFDDGAEPSPLAPKNSHASGPTACPGSIERTSADTYRHLVGTA